MDAEAIRTLATMVLAPIGTYLGGLLQMWWKARQERAAAEQVKEQLDSVRKERDEALRKVSAFREEHESQSIRIAKLENDNARLRRLRDVAGSRVPENERTYFKDTGMQPPDLTPRTKR